MKGNSKLGPWLAPVLGWTSVATAAIVFAVGVLAPTVDIARAHVASSRGGSIGVVAGGTSGWLVLAVLTLVVFGVGAAVVGAVRGERPLWVHGLGAVLTIAAPSLAVAILRIWLG